MYSMIRMIETLRLIKHRRGMIVLLSIEHGRLELFYHLCVILVS